MRRQTPLRKKGKFVRLFFGRIQGYKKSFWNYLTFRSLWRPSSLPKVPRTSYSSMYRYPWYYFVKCSTAPILLIPWFMSDISWVWLEPFQGLFYWALAQCLKMKMKGKKLSKSQFYFPGLLETSLMSKQETIFFIMIGHQR